MTGIGNGRETSFRVALLGDFSGRENRGVCETGDALARRRPREVDRDDLDDVLSKLGVSLRIRLPGGRSPSIGLRFRELDDFHPDRIFARVGIFRSLRETRRALQDPRTFAAAAADLRGEGSAEGSSPARGTGVEPEIYAIASGDLLDHVLEETEERPAGGEKEERDGAWDLFLREIVGPYLVPRDDPRQAEMVAAVDAAAAGMMRSILHQPDFQALEAAWRAVHFLLSRVETGERLSVHLVDVSKAELAKDLLGSGDLRAAGTYRLLAESTVETPGAAPWAMLAGIFPFDRTREDVALLERIARIAARAGAPFVAGASVRPPGRKASEVATTPTKAWDALRALPEAAYLGLAFPRFLLRLPYGPDTDPLETFDFEEMPGDPVRAEYLWGNAAVVCACLLAQRFAVSGWTMRPGAAREIGGLPLHVFGPRADRRATPCAEVVLTESAAEAIMEQGIMPLLSFPGRDTVLLARFQSIADPPVRLAGRWEGGNPATEGRIGGP
jgi:type VI secretion system protein ImpC